MSQKFIVHKLRRFLLVGELNELYENERKYHVLHKNVKKICIYGKKVVPLQSISENQSSFIRTDKRDEAEYMMSIYSASIEHPLSIH